MAIATVDITARVRVRIDPDGKTPTLWGRIALALSILAGRPVLMKFDTPSEDPPRSGATTIRRLLARFDAPKTGRDVPR